MSGERVIRLVMARSECPEPVHPVDEYEPDKTCAWCGAAVWYRAKDSIPILGAEVITCNVCFDVLAPNL